MRVLCVGVATLDIVNVVPDYPPEDSEVRALSQSQRLGGNAANTAVVLAQLGAQVAWAGHLGCDADVADATFDAAGVDLSQAVRCSSASMPTSYVSLSATTGTRTIVHHRKLDEYPADAFANIDLHAYDWLHFEGRAVDQLAEMLAHARAACAVPISLEVEKPRPGIEALFRHPDWLFCSHDYAQAVGCANAETFFKRLPNRLAATCTWGAAGAWAVDASGQLFHAPAPRLTSVVDTLGAGDVFNAGMVFRLGQGEAVATALDDAVRLASAQCRVPGLTLTAETLSAWR